MKLRSLLIIREIGEQSTNRAGGASIIDASKQPEVKE
jgi:hypothetical protein